MNELTADASTRTESVRVRATESGQPVRIRIDPRELQFGGAELARTILQLCQRATESAKAERRTQLADHGMPAEVLDRLALPTSAAVTDAENSLMDLEPAPTSWLRSV
ncbi:hypothetical protein [Rhodococcoides yunnanense]|uniref:hypothetical protein n=1 Tax=Rhodococcoides yunnanense TaxID=278209 RepID=UPI000932528D|nr:hypothetical protein [Rhodococcus yunnanensis]